ncbi:putative DNA-binding ribbon-helix-helix protein [Azospirillum sp. OGB3]|uniref:ribbon-helix-helix domain-containing protein n=1 Tax=Azospirillum sp. OGB3 TaxID=2587012 RepID=UPI0016067398|nr:ribbon-helix-helix domain-containing protein [Azospirillum sp. OGB3]MBB3265732.1 putative DNA-binding ribbon-helix-helix protein [Azospirillum sp. OGB3]
MSGQDSQASNAPSPLNAIPLVARTVKLFGRPTQLRLEPSYWEALDDICHREDLTVDELCSDLKDRLDSQSRRSRGTAVSLANAVRVFIVGYYRKAATEKGHDRAGHGRGDPFVSTPFDLPPAQPAKEG